MPMHLVQLAALLFATTTGFAVAFQLALAAGAPWGAYAMGGRYPGRFPGPLRVAAVVQAAVLSLLAAVILARAALAFPALAGIAGWSSWVVVAVSALSLLLNSISPSVGERRLWSPVAALLLLSSLTVAVAG